jgi:chemosensory pili system protein ChpA (sensor histidine kinase/response regulator)
MPNTPVTIPPSATATPQNEAQSGAPSSADIVLIADDDPDFLLQHSTAFESMGFQVVSCESRSTAVEQLDEVEPALAVVDLMMEESDSGFALCHEIKSRYPQTPIIIVTSASALTGYDFESLTGAQRTWIQADAVLAKPVRYDQIAGHVNRLLDR